MLTKEDILNAVKESDIFKSNLFNHVWLIGSFAKDKATEKSDIDFLVDYNIEEIETNALTSRYNALDFIENTFNRTAQFIPSDVFEKLGEPNYGIQIK